ncbi:MAG: TolC family protein [Planctomycetaceae bacterium]
MARHAFTWSLVVAFVWGLAPRRANAQVPTIETVPPTAPGSTESRLGPTPGAGGGPFGLEPGAGGVVLGGRPGTSTPRVPTTISNPAAAAPTIPPMGIAAPVVPPITAQPIYGTLALPGQLAEEGPPDGLTLDMAIDRMLKENLDLRAKYLEIPQAQADILQAGLRANPLFYADGQLVPYGRYTRERPGGQTQYDVNVSHPFDLSHKRQARTRVATRAKRVLEAQYQEAVRLAINNLYTAYLDVLAARQTVRYAQESLRTLERVRAVTQMLYEKDVTTRPDFDRVKIAQEGTYIGVLDAEEALRQKKRVLGALLNLAPAEAESLELRGTILDKGPPPPPGEVLQQIALAVRPDIVAYRLGVQRAVADVGLAQANRFSDVYVLYQPYTLQDNTPSGLKSPISWALGVTVPLPVYNRNQGGILRAKLNVTQTQIELANLERQARTEVQVAEREYAITRLAIERIEKNLLPTATQFRDDTYKLYIGGEVNVVAFLNAERDYNVTVKQYLDTLVRHRRSMLALNTALGQRVLP